jgi:hypothetical protein
MQQDATPKGKKAVIKNYCKQRTYNSIVPNSIAGAAVSPPTLNLLESVDGLLLPCHATARDLKELNCWFGIHCEIQEERHDLSVAQKT